MGTDRRQKMWVHIMDSVGTDQGMSLWVQIRVGDGTSADIGKYGYRSGIAWVQIGEWIQIIRDHVQIRVLYYIQMKPHFYYIQLGFRVRSKLHRRVNMMHPSQRIY